MSPEHISAQVGRLPNRSLGDGGDGLRMRHRSPALRRDGYRPAGVADLYVSDPGSLPGRPGPRRLRPWFERGARRAPDERFQSARELADDLRRICLGTTPGPVAFDGEQAARGTLRLAPPTMRRPSTPARRRTGWWIGGGALLVAAVVSAMAARSALVPRAPMSDPAAASPSPVAVPVLPAAAPHAVPASPVGAPHVVAADAGKPAPRPARRKARARSFAAPAAAPPVSAAPDDVESVLDHRR